MSCVADSFSNSESAFNSATGKEVAETAVGVSTLNISDFQRDDFTKHSTLRLINLTLRSTRSKDSESLL